jgi:hypothetical protein
MDGQEKYRYNNTGRANWRRRIYSDGYAYSVANMRTTLEISDSMRFSSNLSPT